MTFSEFKLTVASFMQRDPTAFVNGTCDYLEIAINMARRATERMRDFEVCRTQAVLDVDLTDGAELVDAVLATDLEEAISIKTIRKAFANDHNGKLLFPIRVMSREKYVAMFGRAYADHDFDRLPVTETYTTAVVTTPHLVRQADTVFLVPNSAATYGGVDPVTVTMDVIRWLPDYVDDATDFFLTYCSDYMLFKTVTLLTPFLKEDVRTPLLSAQLKDAWQSVVALDSQLVGAGSSDDANLA